MDLNWSHSFQTVVWERKLLQLIVDAECFFFPSYLFIFFFRNFMYNMDLLTSKPGLMCRQ